MNINDLRSPRKRRRLKKIIIRWSIFFAIVAIVIFLLVLGIKAIVKGIISLGQDKENPEITEVVVEEIVATPSPTPIDTNILGYNGSVSTGSLSVAGTEIFTGYGIYKSDTIATIDSENMQSLHAVLIDAQTGEAIAQKDGFTKIYPASMTKVMTVLVAAEHLKEEDLDKKVIISVNDTDYSYSHDLSAVGFLLDESVTVRDLFYGTILPSGADAASALATYVAGDKDTFVEMMNEKVKELGLNNTHFTNCVGLYDDDNYTTCAEMAVIMKAAIENNFCYDVLKEHIYTTSITAEHPEGIEISNWFLRRIEDKEDMFSGSVICAKTGFVVESGNCGVSYGLKNNGHPYICVTAGAHSAWRCIYDHVDIYAKYAK